MVDHDDLARDTEVEHLRNDVTEIRGQLVEVDMAVVAINGTIGALTTAIGKLDVTVEKLLAAENQRIGRDGVWAAILRSPLFLWLAGIATAAGAWLGIGRVH